MIKPSSSILIIYAHAYFGKGAVLSDMRRKEEALQAYGQAVIIDPNYAKAFSNKGTVLYDLGRKKRYKHLLFSQLERCHAGGIGVQIASSK